ncbi:MAG: acylphosphatase [Candidatus Rifleibacteriota bacterium]
MKKFLIYNCKAHGRVQGVGFRSLVSKLAHKHHISGWVRNNRDGSVSIEARGPEETVRSFLDEVKRGNFIARVDELEEIESSMTEDEPAPGFSIAF